ncbi:Sec1, SM superfamily protein [Emiliania huxleyi CCMP1516]|uniref:Uncharacterized protein n=2 Tax=Emiliania huxleyi TaxID=2903 RepID=A0A0D3JE61_EMIH1|nr:Sec1, SM superfamily protein [Emiliania huxleyi CCMP1516]EOD21796.1 Sec1, SM superfamily protein [Emiliania huxleyi CCMP1516]|eukprot:XP_005774225.1 Sec1, SM superfamily protein [Emiliania huxleyi CCMP1516]
MPPSLFRRKKKAEAVEAGPAADAPAGSSLAAYADVYSLERVSARDGPPSGSGGPSLRDRARQRLVSEVFGTLRAMPCGAVLLVDGVTMPVISSLFRVSELMEAGVHLVEHITMRGPDGNYLRRQQLTSLPALYFLTPSVESLGRLIDDFRNPKAPAYASAHLFFSSRVSDALVAKLKASPAMPRVRSFKEVHLEFSLREADLFAVSPSPGAPSALATLFRIDTDKPAKRARLHEVHKIGTSLATLFTTLGAAPIVRAATSAVAAAIACATQEKLDALDRAGALPAVEEAASGAPPPLLLVLDRAFDPLSPLLHEFTYQAMVHDLLPVAEGDRYRYTYVGNSGQSLSKEVLLNEADPLWLRYRHMHIADLTVELDADYKAFLRDNEASAGLASGNADLSEMAAGLRAMPKFQEAMGRWSLHISLVSELVSRYEAFGLEAAALLEQAMACGSSPDGKPCTSPLADLRSLLADDATARSPIDALRLLMVYVVTQEGIKPEVRRELFELAGIQPEDQVAILNLFHLNVNLTHGLKPPKPPQRKQPEPAVEPAASAAPVRESGYDVSRFTPPLRSLAQRALSGELSSDDFPYMRPHLAASAAATPTHEAAGLPSWATDAAAEPAGAAGGAGGGGRRLVVFVAGGVTYAEARELHELGREMGCDVMLGATALLTPQRYVMELKELKALESRVEQRA